MYYGHFAKERKIDKGNKASAKRKFLGGYTDEEREPLVILFKRAEGRAQ